MTTTVEFLAHVLPAHGLYVGLALQGKKRRQQGFDTIEKLAAWCLSHAKDGWDAYHAVASFTEITEKLRSHANVAALRCLILDIDTRESKPDAHYATREQAYVAVAAFCKVACLPPPTVVSSGGGLHLYWALVEMLGLAQWEALASGLKALCQLHGLHADPARTGDGSSVLRTPGTIHQKTGRTIEFFHPQGPWSVEWFKHLEEHQSDRRRTFHHRDRAASIAQLAARVYDDVPADAESIVAECHQAMEFAQSGGNIPEPVWHGHAGVFTFCGERGREIFHDFSSRKFERYRREEADDKLDRTAAAGPTTCARFEALNPGPCQLCRHRGQITSPIVLGRSHGNERVPARVDGVPHETGLEPIPMPEGFGWGAEGELIYQTESKGRPVTTIVARFAIYLCGVGKAETLNEFYYSFRQKLKSTGWREMQLPAGLSTNPKQGWAALTSQGASIRDSTLFFIYVQRAVEMWHEAGKNMDLYYEQYGWKPDGSFLVGSRLYHPDGEVKRVHGSGDVETRANWLGPVATGSLQRWSEAANRLLAGKPTYQLFAVSSFAAALVSFQREMGGGPIQNVTTPASGTGKTSVCLAVAASVWGEARGTAILKADTQAARGLTYATLNNLPIIFDELGLVHSLTDPAMLKDFVFAYSNGRDKMRATSGGTGVHHVQNTWRTIMLGSSNQSLNDCLSVYGLDPEAPLMRVMEFPVTYGKDMDSFEVDTLSAQLFDNRGHAGDAFVRWIVKPEVVDWIKKAIAHYTAVIWKEAAMEPKYRIWVHALGCHAVAAEIVRSLKILDVDASTLVSHAINELRYEARQVNEHPYDNRVNPELQERCRELLGGFINAHMADFLVVQRHYRAALGTQEPIQRPRGKLLGRYEIEDAKLFVAHNELKRWYVDFGFPWRDALGCLRLMNVLVAEGKLVTLTAGTPLPGGQVRCLEIDMSAPVLAALPRLVA